jgi:hypothetical protein
LLVGKAIGIWFRKLTDFTEPLPGGKRQLTGAAFGSNVQGGGNSKRVKILNIFKNLLQNQQAKINQIWYISSLGEGN